MIIYGLDDGSVPSRTEIFLRHKVQTVYECHPASCALGAGLSFLEGKTAGTWSYSYLSGVEIRMHGCLVKRQGEPYLALLYFTLPYELFVWRFWKILDSPTDKVSSNFDFRKKCLIIVEKKNEWVRVFRSRSRHTVCDNNRSLNIRKLLRFTQRTYYLNINQLRREVKPTTTDKRFYIL